MAIDLGDTPAGTPPTDAQKLQICSAIGAIPMDAQTPLRRVWKKIADMQAGTIRQLVVSPVGDSVANLTLDGYLPKLSAMLGVCGIVATSGPNVQYTGSGAISDGSAIAYDYTISPTGLFYRLNAAGTITFGINSTSGILSDTIKIFYIIEPGAGNFTVQTSLSGAAFVDEASATNVAAAGSLSLGVITIPKTEGVYRVRLNYVSGTTRFLMPFIYDSLQSGIVVYPMFRGGVALSDYVSTNSGIVSSLLTAVAPDLVHFEMLDIPAQASTSDWTSNLGILQTRFDAVVPNADWIFCAGTPQSVLAANDGVILQNALTRQHAETQGRYFFDQYSLIGNYAALVANAWEGDGVHRATGASLFLAGQLWRLALSSLNAATQASASVLGALDNGILPTIQASQVGSDPALTLYTPDGNGGYWAYRILGTQLNNRGLRLQAGRGAAAKGAHVFDTVAQFASNAGSGGTGSTAVVIGSGNPGGDGKMQFGTSGNTLIANGIGWGTNQGLWRDANGLMRFGINSTVFNSSGTGSPEGVVTAGIGSLYTRIDGSTGTTLYVKEGGVGNTGWVAK